MNRSARRLRPSRRCEAVEFYDDMYPEFAPEPIEVKCHERATHEVIAYWQGQEGRRPIHTRECARHAHEGRVERQFGCEAVIVKALGR